VKPILMGKAKQINVTMPALNTVWMDDTGAMALIVKHDVGGFFAQLDWDKYEFIPFFVASRFMESVECLGEL